MYQILLCLVVRYSKNKRIQTKYIRVWILDPVFCIVCAYVKDLALSHCIVTSVNNSLLVQLSSWRNYSWSKTCGMFLGSYGSSGWIETSRGLSSSNLHLKVRTVWIRPGCSGLYQHTSSEQVCCSTVARPKNFCLISCWSNFYSSICCLFFSLLLGIVRSLSLLISWTYMKATFRSPSKSLPCAGQTHFVCVHETFLRACFSSL